MGVLTGKRHHNMLLRFWRWFAEHVLAQALAIVLASGLVALLVSQTAQTGVARFFRWLGEPVATPRVLVLLAAGSALAAFTLLFAWAGLRLRGAGSQARQPQTDVERFRRAFRNYADRLYAWEHEGRDGDPDLRASFRKLRTEVMEAWDRVRGDYVRFVEEEPKWDLRRRWDDEQYGRWNVEWPLGALWSRATVDEALGVLKSLDDAVEFDPEHSIYDGLGLRHRVVDAFAAWAAGESLPGWSVA